MERVEWRRVRSTDFPVPADASLSDLTTELTGLLGSGDAELRDELALPVLTTWISRGVYDDLLVGLGDGIATGLSAGLAGGRTVGATGAAGAAGAARAAGAAHTDGVFRRSRSAAVLAACLLRDQKVRRLPAERVLDWTDRTATWLLAERDLRSHLDGCGWVRAVSLGADALAAAAGSAHLGEDALGVVVDVIAERVTAPAAPAWAADEADRLAAAALAVMRRDLLPLDRWELWVATIGDRSFGVRTGAGTPDPVAANADAFVRAIYLQLALAPRPPAIRADLLLTVVAVLRELHPGLLGG